MDKEPYRVHVVVDPACGERLRTLPKGEPAWVVDSAENWLVIRSLWKERSPETQLEGITSFKFDPTGVPEDWLLDEISTIDLHHGEYSNDPPYSVLNVIGVAWSDRIAEVLSEYGFVSHEPTAEGFVTRREIDPAAE
jgi:hypothetical protein